MLLFSWTAAFAAEPLPIPGAVLHRADRIEVGATSLVEGMTGARTLLIGENGATLLGQDGDPVARVEARGIDLADVSSGDRFVLVHDGGITLHQGGRELVRLGAVGAILDVALSPDGRFLAIATTVGLSMYDSVDGRTIWSVDGEATLVTFDIKGRLYAVKKGTLIQLDLGTGRQKPTTYTAPPEPPGLLPDGCVPVPVGTFCPSGKGGTGLQRPDGAVWVLREGVFDRWRPLPADKVLPIGADGGSTAIAWVGADLLVARTDGSLERRGPDGGVQVTAQIPSCQSCMPALIGGESDGSFFAVAPDGAWQRWGPDGAPLGRVGKPMALIDIDRLADGRWATLDVQGRARVGKKPGTGKPTKKAEGVVGLDAAGESVAVWGDRGVWVYTTGAELRAHPDLGPERRPVTVALSADGGTVAVLDDRGTLHAYRVGDGRAIFRASVQVEGDQLAWAPGRGFLLAGGAPLRVFGATDGKEVARVELAPDGVIRALAIADSGAIGVIHASDAVQILRRIEWATLAQ